MVATCSNDAIPLIKDLGSDVIIDYKSSDSDAQLHQMGGYSSFFEFSFVNVHYTNVYVRKNRFQFRLDS